MPAKPHSSSPATTSQTSSSEADPASPGLRALAVVLFVIAAAAVIAGIVLAIRGGDAIDAAPGVMAGSFLTVLGVLALMKARGPRR